MASHGRHGAADSGPPDLLTLLADPQVAAAFVRRSLPPRSLISTPQHPANFIFIVESGRVRVYLSHEDKELSLSYLEPGDVFSTHTSAFLRAETPSVLLTTDTGRFAALLQQHPEYTPAIIRVLGGVLQASLDRIEDLAFRDVAGRLARFLTHSARQRGRPQADGSILVNLALSTEDIALLLGSTRQTVSSLINALQRQGVVQRSGRGKLLILQPEALADWKG